MKDFFGKQVKEYVVGDEVRTNKTVLGKLSDLKQGTDGWWFLEGSSLSSARVLSYMKAK